MKPLGVVKVGSGVAAGPLEKSNGGLLDGSGLARVIFGWERKENEYQCSPRRLFTGDVPRRALEMMSCFDAFVLEAQPPFLRAEGAIIKSLHLASPTVHRL